MKKLILSFVLLVVFAQFVFPQNVGKDKKDEISPELKKEAVAFLRETATDINSLRSLENRISFASETANLMWFNDEKEARTMFRAIINDFSQLLAQYNAQAVTAETAVDANEESFVAGGGRNNMTRKFVKALNVRQQIATSLAENDASLAFDFLTDTALAVTSPTFRKQIEQSDAYFQTRLLGQIAAQNPETALKYGRQTLAKGFNYEHINLLKKIYAKDADKGASFGEDIIQKLKSDGINPSSSSYFAEILSLGFENQKLIEKTPGKTPMFSEQSLREVADLFAQQILKINGLEGEEINEYLPQIEKFAPARAAQIRQKYAAKIQSVSNGISNGGGSIPPPPRPPQTPGAIGQSEREQQSQMMEGLQNLNTKQLSKEERQKVVGQARKIIAGIKEPTERLFALSALAAQVAVADKELALQIMDEAKNSVNLQPKNYQEFLQIWLLVGGYAQVDADKAFPILEDAIFRINDTISAAVKVAEFIDTDNEIVEDGEVQIGSFGGGMTRDLLRGLGATDTTIKSLAKTDFARTKALTNKFDRPEARILAKMLVLRSIFGEKKQTGE